MTSIGGSNNYQNVEAMMTVNDIARLYKCYMV